MKQFFGSIYTYIKCKWWYLVLLAGSSWFVYQNKTIILSLEFDKITSINLIFIFWIVLLLLPLFSEMEFFGVKLKKEVEKAKSEVKESLTDLKMHLVQFQVSNSVANTIQVGNNFMPSEDKMEELRQLVRRVSEDVPTSKVETTIDNTDKSVYLFKIRLSIETILSELLEKIGYVDKMPLYNTVQLLYKHELINGITVDLINQVNKIANRGVHGEIVSDEYINFVKETYPEIQRQLKEVKGKLYPVVCSRCKFTGYSKYENVCPQCGYTDGCE